jgi:hypothetical protein
LNSRTDWQGVSRNRIHVFAQSVPEFKGSRGVVLTSRQDNYGCLIPLPKQPNRKDVQSRPIHR